MVHSWPIFCENDTQENYLSISLCKHHLMKLEAVLWYYSTSLIFGSIIFLAALIAIPFSSADLVRNPAAKNQGKFMTLAKFLDFAKTSTVSGILISIEVRYFLGAFSTRWNNSILK